MIYLGRSFSFVVVLLDKVELGCSLPESLTHAFRKGRIVLLFHVVLDFIQLVAWSTCVGRDVDTSMLLRTVASPETLNGYRRWETGLERCLCVLEVLTLQGRTGG